MFGGLWGKKKEPTVLGGKSNGVPGMPAGLYSSKDVENLRFHDKRRVWYDAKQVDDALDKVQATLEWWESKSGLKPGSGTEPTEVSSKVDSGMEAGPGSPLSIDVDHLAVHDEAGSKPVLSGQVQSGVEHTVDVAPKPPRTAPVAEPADKRAGTTLEELSELASKADSAKPAHAAPSIPLPEVPSVPVIPTNPFLRRR